MGIIVGVQHREDGTIGKYKLDDGRILSQYEAVDEAEAGNLDGVAVFTTRSGDKAIRSNAGQPNYKLEDLPEF